MTPFDSFKEKQYNKLPFDWSGLHNPFGFHTQITPQKCDVLPPVATIQMEMLSKYGMSDISAHLPFLEFLSSKCNHVTEFGTRNCNSVSAFIAGCKGIVESYDIEESQEVRFLQSIDLPCTWLFRRRSTITPGLEINQTDLLFLDTVHTYDHITQELNMHHTKVNRWICCHDTFSYEVNKPPGILTAITDFIQMNKEWKIVYHVDFNHGLTLLEKI